MYSDLRCSCRRFLSSCRRFLGGAVVAGATALLLPAGAGAVTIVNGSELFTTGIGTLFAVGGNQNDSSPGLVLEVLGGSIAGNPNAPESLQSNGSEDGTNTLTMGAMRALLEAQGIVSTSSLVFGFGLNELGSTCSNGTCGSIDITSGFDDDFVSNVPGVRFSIELPGGGGTDVFDLGTDTVTIFNYQQGQNDAEAKLQIDLGFDILTEYTNSSTEAFGIDAFIDNTTDGFEIIFLSGGFTADPPTPPVIPEPSTVMLLGAGLLGLALKGRRKV